MKWGLFVIFLASVAFIPAMAQEIQVSRQNKTISVLAEDSATAEPEVATITIGYHNYGATNDSAFQENVRASNQITKALLEAQIPKENIATESLQLQHAQVDVKWTPEMRKERQFEADQSWKVRVLASEAHTVIDVATRAGANQMESVVWGVADPTLLQAKASGAALAKAKAIAEQMAKGLNAKLGDLVYASNKSPEQNNRFTESFWMRRSVRSGGGGGGDRAPTVVLYPQKVTSDATVYAVFAIE